MEQKQEEATQELAKNPGGHLKLFYITSVAAVVIIIVSSLVLPKLALHNDTSKQLSLPVSETAPETEAEPNEQIISEEATETAPTPTPEAEASIAPQTPEAEKIHELEQKILSLETSHTKEIAELKSKFSEEAMTMHRQAGSQISALLAFSRLKEAVKNGEPYGQILDQLKQSITSDHQINDVISELSVSSLKGIVPPASLKTQFPALANKALAIRANGIVQNTIGKFVSIRKIGEREGSDDEAVLARAEMRLKDGNIKATVEELESLSQPAQEVFKDWLTDSAKWLDTNVKLDLLQMLLTQTGSQSQI